LWARGYFCAGVGPVDEDTIRRYIENLQWDEPGTICPHRQRPRQPKKLNDYRLKAGRLGVATESRLIAAEAAWKAPG
jgi:hypothetical protein